MWFESLTGFREENAEQVRSNIVVDGETMTSTANGREMACGRLETPTLAELRSRARANNQPKGSLSLSEVIGDVQKLHLDPANAGALFQVASQFNLLEMVSPSVTPENGVTIYENDRTQGPACAIACGAGTIYRNYFATVDGQLGQSSDNQIDCLRDLGQALGNTDERLWAMRNGYALATAEGLREISAQLSSAGESERDALRQMLRIGIHSGTQVTLDGASHAVSQTYCSALPVAYSVHTEDLWADFAQLVLEAAYEATICAAILNCRETRNNELFLTLLGGGAFGNRDDWIFTAIERALTQFADVLLDVSIVSYGASKPRVQELVRRLQQ
ncbi:MAG: hypothetical protein CMJ48_13310 [Planctomycetaceae bacterium]|nr:hypothetical protein [Planctomycetaceae bacterium]